VTLRTRAFCVLRLIVRTKSDFIPEHC